MAAEIALQSYLFLPPKERDTFERIRRRMLGGGGDPLSDSETEEVLWANYLHDLESIWWILIWVLFNFKKATNIESTTSTYHLQVKEKGGAYEELFPQDFDHLKRQTFLQQRRTFESKMGKASCSLPEIYNIAASMRESLCFAYDEEEKKLVKDLPIKLVDGGMLHKELLKILGYFPDECTNLIHVSDVPSDSVINRRSLKRPRYDVQEGKRPGKKAR